MSKTKRRIEKLEQFEKSICTIIDNYFETNEKHDLDFSTDCSSDKFYHFVKSVDEKFKKLSKIEEENKELELEKAENGATIVCLQNEIDEKDAIIKAQSKEIETLAEQKSNLEVQLIAKNRASARKGANK